MARLPESRCHHTPWTRDGRNRFHSDWLGRLCEASLSALCRACDTGKVRGAGENVDRLISFFGNSPERLPGMQEAECSNSKALLPMFCNCRNTILK